VVRTLNGLTTYNLNLDTLTKAADIDSWQVDGYIGASTNSISNAIAQVSNGDSTQQVAYGSTGSYLSYLGPYPNYFRVCSDDAYQGYAMAEILRYGFPSWRTVTVFSTTGSDMGYGSDLYQQFQLHANEVGLSVASNHQFRANLDDLTLYINAAKEVGTRVFVLFMQGDDAANLIYQGWKLGLFKKDTQIVGSNQILGPETIKSTKFPPESLTSIAEIMKGAIAVRQSVLTSSPTEKYLDWVKRWKKQLATAPQDSHGAYLFDYVNGCNKTVDDSSLAPAPRPGKHYLYQGQTIQGVMKDGKVNETLVWRCAGVDFSKFSDDGSDIAPLAPFVYDAVLTLAWGLHKSIFVGPASGDGSVHTPRTGLWGTADYYGGIGGLGTVLGEDNLPGVTPKGTPFIVDGVTGRIKIRQGDSTGYGYGDRELDVSFDVLNFQPATYCADLRSGGLQTIGRWTAAYPVDASNYAANYVPSGNNSRIVFNTGDNKIPFDRTPPVINSLPDSASAVLIVLGVISILLALGFGIMIVRSRHLKLVRAYQPLMLYLVLFGFLLASVRTLIAGVAFTTSVCIADVWFGHLAFWTVFSTLTMKTWRVHLIINSSFRRIKISTQMVVLSTLGVVLFVCFYLALLTGLGAPHKDYQVRRSQAARQPGSQAVKRHIEIALTINQSINRAHIDIYNH